MVCMEKPCVRPNKWMTRRSIEQLSDSWLLIIQEQAD